MINTLNGFHNFRSDTHQKMSDLYSSIAYYLNSSYNLIYKGVRTIINYQPKKIDSSLFSEDAFSVCPGVTFIYNTVNTYSLNETRYLTNDYIEINYCKSGRFECEFDSNTLGYLNQGDFAINRRNYIPCNYSFPLEHYEGITILVELSALDSTISLPGIVPIDTTQLWKMLCPNKHCVFLHNNEIIQSLFNSLYILPIPLRERLHLVKWIELLLYLSSDDLTVNLSESSYLPHQQLEIIKEIEHYLITNIDGQITINELSTTFSISSTLLKNRFKLVFGKPIFQYMREYRCNLATELLNDREKSITDIAACVGYANSSKFSSAYTKICGISPSMYRKKQKN